jgi:hypothetical protein
MKAGRPRYGNQNAIIKAAAKQMRTVRARELTRSRCIGAPEALGCYTKAALRRCVDPCVARAGAPLIGSGGYHAP